LEQQAHHEKMIESAKSQVQPDYNFTDSDQKSAIEKLKASATNFDRYGHTGDSSLQSFEGSSLSPSEFYSALKKGFNLTLSRRELGAMVKRFEGKEEGRINCANFVAHFLKLGFKERCKQDEFRRRGAVARSEAEDKRRDSARRDRSPDSTASKDSGIDFKFTHADLQSAVQKIALASRDYNPNSPTALRLDAFDCKSMRPLLFRSMLKRCLQIKLTNKELGALMSIFDKTGGTEASKKDT